jgi:hypothetical protein
MEIGYLLPALTLLLGAAVGLSAGLFLVPLLHRRLLANRLPPAASVPCPSQSFPGESP